MRETKMLEIGGLVKNYKWQFMLIELKLKDRQTDLQSNFLATYLLFIKVKQVLQFPSTFYFHSVKKDKIISWSLLRAKWDK